MKYDKYEVGTTWSENHRPPVTSNPITEQTKDHTRHRHKGPNRPLATTGQDKLQQSCASHLQQVGNLAPEAVTPLEEMVPEDAGHAWVGQDVSIALTNMVIGEGPVGLRGACVVVINKSLQVDKQATAAGQATINGIVFVLPGCN